MRYLIEPKDRIYVKGYGFLSLARNMFKNLSNKYRAIQKPSEATGDLTGNKIADKITNDDAQNDDANNEIEVLKKI